MAPTIADRISSGDELRRFVKPLSSTLSSLSIRDVSSSGVPLTSVFALVLSSGSSVSRRALTSLSELPSYNTAITSRSGDTIYSSPLFKRQQNVILAIPTTYKGLNSGPSPGAVVGIMLGSILGFILVLYVFLISWTFFVNRSSTVIKEEVVVKRRSHRSKSRKSSHHSAPPPPPPPAMSEHISEHISVHESFHEPSPPPPPRRSRTETIVEVEEQYVRHSHHSASPSPSPSPDPEEVVVEEEESLTEEIVEVIEEQSSIVSSPSPPTRHSPPRRPSANGRRSGFRVVDPAEFGGGGAPMRKINSRRSSRPPS